MYESECSKGCVPTEGCCCVPLYLPVLWKNCVIHMKLVHLRHNLIWKSGEKYYSKKINYVDQQIMPF